MTSANDVAQSRKQQGLPPVVTDPTVLAKLAKLLNRKGAK